MKRALLLLGACLVLGCAPGLSLRTPAPPSATLKFEPLRDTVELTQGVAAGFEVWCAWGPCQHLRATTDAPAIAHVYPAHLGALRFDWEVHNPHALVLVGAGAGQTILHVADGSNVRDITVIVRPATAATK